MLLESDGTVQSIFHVPQVEEVGSFHTRRYGLDIRTGHEGHCAELKQCATLPV